MNAEFPLPPIRPMLAVTGPMPTLAEQSSWAYEMKWDGVRAVGLLRAGEFRLFARSGREITGQYPELAGFGADPGRDLVVDGEIVAFDDEGKVSFAALQPRIHGDPRQSRRPVAYLVFDLLFLDGVWTTERPYQGRRALLEQLGLTGPNWNVSPSFVGIGESALAASQAHGLEGVVAKRLDSTYHLGRRSPGWRKIKNIRTQDVVIGGWRTGKDSRASTFGSLLCGVYEPDGRLAYVGRVGSGFDSADLLRLRDRMAGLATSRSPFDSSNRPVPRLDESDAHWVRPVLVGEVVFAEWTPDGRLWHPRWRGLRTDKDPREVTTQS